MDFIFGIINITNALNRLNWIRVIFGRGRRDQIIISKSTDTS